MIKIMPLHNLKSVCGMQKNKFIFKPALYFQYNFLKAVQYFKAIIVNVTL